MNTRERNQWLAKQPECVQKWVAAVRKENTLILIMDRMFSNAAKQSK